ncbi:ABC transporter substrate-binding protein [Paenibacillus sp. 1001270B_150601_E10]|uniref:ABC transporter substrate-binding protein n=1 Tax=Paenibacillus sp. 1001270B_150601_E10 TaxID=2787079 RepID=UPI001E32F09F|nr:ABC transporter substrate-binding protein [Paenibacillus sp. 1001270B_150601_E10]
MEGRPNMRVQKDASRIVISVLLTMLMTMSISSCTSSTDSREGRIPNSSMVNLTYYTIGEPDKDLKMVNEKLNELLAEKIGITVTYLKVGWQEYEERLNTMVSTGTPFDIAYAPDYVAYYQRGAWLRLDDYLSNVGKEMYDTIDPIFWQGMRMEDGGIYGVPTNKELAVIEQWMYPEELIDKYQLDISKYTTVESLEPLFRMIKQKEPSYLPMELDKDSNNFFSLYGYEYVSDKKLPLMVRSFDEKPQVVNIFDTKEARQVLHTLRDYYIKGYINEDAALRDNQGLNRGDKVFWKGAGGGPLSENSWSKDRGYRVVAYPVTPKVVTSESVRGGVMAVNAVTKHPVECIKFLNLLNTDPEVRNLMNYGIEGIHYSLDHNGQVVPITPEEDNNDASANLNNTPGYSAVQFTQGNWFILNTMGGKVPEPLDKWEQFREFNATVTESNVLGFTPDLTQMPIQIQNIVMVWEKYYPGLMTGSLDVDKELPKFNQELRQAGIYKVITEVQKQLDAWLAARTR